MRLLAAAMLPCLAVARAGEADGSAAGPGMLSCAAARQPSAVSPEPYINLPGTPSTFNNPGGQTIVVGYNVYSARPAPVSGSSIFNITSTAAGDIVMLRDPAGSNDPSNWVAVFRFLNLDDPTGALGLSANEVEGFDASNVGPGGFTGFRLFPNTVYLADTERPPSSHFTFASELGTGGNGLFVGQTGTLVYTVTIPEPATWLELLAGAGAIAGVLRRRASRF